jgi:glucose-1-phosphate thymidylyltransferase
MEIARALILTGRGRNDRPWPTVPAGPKHLFPVANRPILFHNLEALRAAGLIEATILVERDAADPIRHAVGDGARWGLSVRYAEYRPAGGLSGALTAAGGHGGDEPVLVQHGDALLRDRMHAHIQAFARERLDALALQLDPAGLPAPAYMLSSRAVSRLRARPDAGADPLADLSDHRVRVQQVDGCLPCHGEQDKVLECNRRVLEGLVADVPKGVARGCEIQGAVVVHPSARIENSVVRGPAIIGAGARLVDAYVGPYSSIGADVVLEAVEIEHSIVLAGAQLRFLGARLESSIIGQGARIVRGFGLPNAMRVTVGHRAEIRL